VKDKEVADLLCPHYPIVSKRPPVGHFYYEAFNRDNVNLVDIKSDPIQEITSAGLRTSGREFEFDMIIFAIGESLP
jgi:cyclohexanone monooxygenase